MSTYVAIFGLGFLACVTITLAGVLVWEYLSKKSILKKEDDAEIAIQHLTIEDIRKRNSDLSLDDLVRRDNAAATAAKKSGE